MVRPKEIILSDMEERFKFILIEVFCDGGYPKGVGTNEIFVLYSSVIIVAYCESGIDWTNNAHEFLAVERALGFIV